MDSPATSMQDMAGSRSTVTTAASTATASSDLTPTTSQFQQSAQTYWDSDFETEPDAPDWRLSINQDDLSKLNPRERKRQDVINGKRQIWTFVNWKTFSPPSHLLIGS